MKQFNEYIQDLSELNSPYYGGSTCMLSLYQTFMALSKLGYNVDDELDICIKLFDEDAMLFDISKRKSISSGDYLIVINSLQHYYELITNIIDVENKLNNSVLIKYFCAHLNFLISIVRCNFAAFKDREDLLLEFNEVKSKFDSFNELYAYDTSDNNGLDFSTNYQIVLPCLKLLVKLMTRKQYSKRGFSNNVDVKYVVDNINNLQGNVNQSNVLKVLNNIAYIIDKAVLEIKDFSLISDYLYIKKIILIFVFTYKK